MAAPVAPTQPKSPKKKVARAVERTDSPARSTASGPAADDGFGSPYIKELQKNIRNVNKKIANASKTDSLLAQHPGKSLDLLVASRIINADQKTQILKKPALEAQVAQYEEQLAQIIKIDEQYRAQAAADKAELEQRVEKAKAQAVAEAKADFEKTQKANLLLISQFLRLAAYRREDAADPESDESQAIEGVLLAIYTGDDSAVSSMLKLVNGSSDRIVSVPGELLQTNFHPTYARITDDQIKTIARTYKMPYDAEAVETDKEVATDPTIANATVNEIAAEGAPSTNGHAVETATNGISNMQVADDAANAAAAANWDTQNDTSSTLQDWVQVPRNPGETEAGSTAAPTKTANRKSWADDHPEPSAQAPVPTAAAADPGDGFHQVQRNRGRSEREGSGHRGRGRGGYRGDGRGRGRGNRNGGPARGGRRNGES
ncbi:hypothetical protein GMORB2_0130 [Geosmithia morbida]|uniref:YAG7-like dimerisation domain-containing protein n=1 Tax=Geosmithia morbida TaxID=1094350 RepID=A0A9P5D9D0_9HYPO|nr:uncharacterized protein GMORB2_0130 [Geosmithia morbida]KAF4126394.1 hypothetical protein GMORB2_0130 [Geosmithia morbida]